jgi:hypothetical protein
VVYKKGSENRVADALSRRTHDLANLQLISSATPDWLTPVQVSYQSDPQATELITKLSLHSDFVPHFTFKDGLMRYKSRIWIGQDPALRSQLIAALHNLDVGGHSSSLVTYRRLKQISTWRGMKSEVQQFVQTCQVCLQAKPDISKYPGKLQPLPTPMEALQIVSVDFIEGPKSESASCILMIMDKFTHYGHFIPLYHPYTTSSLAMVFMNEVYMLHVMLVSIISTHDLVFASKFWQSLFKYAGIQLRMSSSYHPQMDGQTERVNQCLETFLRCFVHACPKKWKTWLAAAEF